MAVLDTLYVDVVERGLREANRGVSDLQRQLEEAARAGRGLRAEMETTGMSVKQLSKMAQDFSSGMVRGATAVVAPLSAATTTIVGLAQAGLQGTMQAERLSRAYTEFTRLIAGALLPVVDAIASGFETVNRWLGQAGVTGQQVFLIVTVGIVAATVAATVFLFVLSGIAVAVTVATGGINALIGAAIGLGLAIDAALVVGAAGALAGLMSLFAESRAAVGALVAALGQLWQAYQPILEAYWQLIAMMAKAFVVDPLVEFINNLTVAALVVEKLLTAFVKIKEVAMLLGRIKAMAPEIGQGKPKEVTLNQTGTENAQGTFARIQEAVLKAAPGDEKKDEHLAQLTKLRIAAESIYNTIEKYLKAAGQIANVVSDVNEGVKQDGYNGALGVLAGKAADWVRRRGR